MRFGIQGAVEGGEVGAAHIVLHHCLAVDDRAHARKRFCGSHDAWVVRSPVEAATAERASSATLDKHERPEAVVLDLVQPVIAGRRLIDERRRERWDEGKRRRDSRLTRD